jgi:hypothetical protein
MREPRGRRDFARAWLASARGFTFLPRMDLATARRHIQASFDRMRAVYLRPVFDEWAVIAVPGKNAGLLAYSGLRPEAFLKKLPEDAEPLRAASTGKTFAEGDIEFVPDAADTRYDAFMKLGPGSYLVLNNTAKTMNEIRADGNWLGVQAAIFELGEKFRADPLEG